jgi:YidC/Oxa1 family membrane protein insertase
MAYIMPFFALTGLYWPFGLVLYWVTTNVWTLIQQWALFKRYPYTPPSADGTVAATAGAGTVGARALAPNKPTVKTTVVKSSAGKGSGAAKTDTKAGGATGQNGSGPSANGSSPAKSGTGGSAGGNSGGGSARGSGGNSGAVKRRLGRGRAEQPEQPEPAEVKLVRQQKQRQTRSKRSGKR